MYVKKYPRYISTFRVRLYPSSREVTKNSQKAWLYKENCKYKHLKMCKHVTHGQDATHEEHQEYGNYCAFHFD